jgi:hypothetical protein
MIKLCVGTDRVGDLAAWQAERRTAWPDNLPRHVTRMWPKRAAELLDGGSLYWVMGGLVLCRQRILRLDRVEGEDGIARCSIVLDPELHQTHAAPRRPFQGWRYLTCEDAPPDLRASRASDDTLPEHLNRALAEIGLR